MLCVLGKKLINYYHALMSKLLPRDNFWSLHDFNARGKFSNIFGGTFKKFKIYKAVYKAYISQTVKWAIVVDCPV